MLLPLVMWTAACGAEDGTQDGMFQPLADTTAPTMAVREVVSVGGGAGAEGGAAFQRVSGLAVGPDGGVWVVDGPAGRIVVLDERGREVRRFGGQGEGPGEFTVAGPMGFLGDTVWVVDAFSRRTTRFSLEGRVLGTATDTVPVNPVRFRNPARPSAYLVGGSMLVVPYPRGADAGAQAPVLRVQPGGRDRDTLALRAAWTTSIPVPAGSFGFNPLTDHTLVSVDSRGRWVVTAERSGDSSAGSRLLVRVRRLEVGDSVGFDVRYAVEGDPVTAALRDSVIEAGVERLRANMELISELQETIDDPRAVIEAAIRVPDHRPPVTALVAASDGTTWLARHGVSEGLRTWTVLGPGGSVLRHVRIPVAIDVRDAAGDRIWGVATDTLDVQRVAGLDVVAPEVGAGAGVAEGAPPADEGAGGAAAPRPRGRDRARRGAPATHGAGATVRG